MDRPKTRSENIHSRLIGERDSNEVFDNINQGLTMQINEIILCVIAFIFYFRPAKNGQLLTIKLKINLAKK